MATLKENGIFAVSYFKRLCGNNFEASMGDSLE